MRCDGTIETQHNTCIRTHGVYINMQFLTIQHQRKFAAPVERNNKGFSRKG